MKQTSWPVDKLEPTVSLVLADFEEHHTPDLVVCVLARGECWDLIAKAGGDAAHFEATGWSAGELIETRRPPGSSFTEPMLPAAEPIVVASGETFAGYLHGLVSWFHAPESGGRLGLIYLSRRSPETSESLQIHVARAAYLIGVHARGLEAERRLAESSPAPRADTQDDGRRVALLEILAAVSEGAGANRQFNLLATETFNRIVDELALVGGALYFGLDDAWILVAHRGFDETFPLAAGFLPAPALEWTRSREPLVDLELGPPLGGLFTEHHVQSSMFLPLIENNEVKGGMILASRQTSAFDSELVEILARIGAQLEATMRHAEVVSSLEEQAHELEAVVANLTDALLVVTQDYRIITLNPAASELLSISAGPTQQSRWQDIFPLYQINSGAPADAAHPVEKAFYDGRRQPPTQWNLELQDRTPVVSATAAPVLDRDTGAVRSVVLVLRDISEQHARDRKVMAAEKYASVSTLAAGVAHEFKNYLAGIVGNASLVQGQAKEHAAIATAAQRILDIGARANQTALALLSYVRDTQVEQMQLNLAAVIGEMLCLIDERAHKQNIHVSSDLAMNLVAEVVPTKLRQVVLNVLTNAVEAMPSGGDLRLVLTLEESWCLLSISDTGVGIAAEDLPKIFDPFFSTKGVWGEQKGAGTGLGLTTSLNYVREMGGDLQLESTLGQGTTVSIRLPAAVSSGSTAPAWTSDVDRYAVILETDAEFRAHLESSLGDAGWDVDAANDLAQLTALTQARLPAIVVLDALMPGKVTFIRAFEQIAEAFPDCRILVSTGDATDYQLAEYMSRARCRLVKSTGPAGISAALRSILAPSAVRA